MGDNERLAMLTTVDNPYNPFTHFDEWCEFDESKGYHSCSYLARIAKTSDELSDSDINQAIEDAIDEICFYNVLGIYKKVTMLTKDYEKLRNKQVALA